MIGKHSIHTTLSKEAMQIIERYEKELGSKNTVLEKALLEMNKNASKKALKLNEVISKVNIKILQPLVGGITEGAVFGIIGPTASGKTLLVCAIINDFLLSSKKQCVFVSSINKLSYIIPITNSLGMRLGSFTEELFLDFCKINAIDDIFWTVQKSKPKLLVIDDLHLIQENGSNDLVNILNSSGWSILSEEIRNQKAICVVTSEEKNISRHCDIVIELEKANGGSNSITVKVIKNIGMTPSAQFALKICDRVEIVPLSQRIKIVDNPKIMTNGDLEDELKRARQTELAKRERSVLELAKSIITKEKLTSEQKDAMAKIGINLPELNLLRLVIKADGITRKELQTELKLFQPIVSKIVNNFLKKGLLAQPPETENKRNVPLMPVIEKIEQELGDLVEMGLLPSLSNISVIKPEPEQVEVGGDKAEEQRKKKFLDLRKIAEKVASAENL